jgi:signal transduction histidine kinase
VDDSNFHLDAHHGWRTLQEVGFAACVLDRRLRYRRANAAWRAYLQGDTFRFGRQSGSWRNREILADVPADRRERWSQALNAIVGGQLGHFLDRAVEAHALGERLVVTIASPTIDAEGQVDGVLCVRYDATEAQRTVANQERLAEVLLAARRLQHYLGNQLALTLGYVELLTFDPRLPDELRDRVDEALRGVIEASETLSRLRLVTRLELRHDDPSLAEQLGPSGPPP